MFRFFKRALGITRFAFITYIFGEFVGSISMADLEQIALCLKDIVTILLS